VLRTFSLIYSIVNGFNTTIISDAGLSLLNVIISFSRLSSRSDKEGKRLRVRRVRLILILNCKKTSVCKKISRYEYGNEHLRPKTGGKSNSVPVSSRTTLFLRVN
jgi:hypothetical protein